MGVGSHPGHASSPSREWPERKQEICDPKPLLGPSMLSTPFLRRVLISGLRAHRCESHHVMLDERWSLSTCVQSTYGAGVSGLNQEGCIQFSYRKVVISGQLLQADVGIQHLEELGGSKGWKKCVHGDWGLLLEQHKVTAIHHSGVSSHFWRDHNRIEAASPCCIRVSFIISKHSNRNLRRKMWDFHTWKANTQNLAVK